MKFGTNFLNYSPKRKFFHDKLQFFIVCLVPTSRRTLHQNGFRWAPGNMPWWTVVLSRYYIFCFCVDFEPKPNFIKTIIMWIQISKSILFLILLKNRSQSSVRTRLPRPVCSVTTQLLPTPRARLRPLPRRLLRVVVLFITLLKSLRWPVKSRWRPSDRPTNYITAHNIFYLISYH